ncbi:MAG: hypothetical protein R6X32_21640 [Chloroflexota bacterium]
MLSGPQNNYQAYLLRLWRDDANTPWRASLQETHGSELVSFASVAQLIAFIEQQTSPDEPVLRHRHK